MTPLRIFYFKGWFWLAIVAFLLASCQSRPTETSLPNGEETATQATVPSAAPTTPPELPSPTPQPLAVRISRNGSLAGEISLASYEAELKRYQQATGQEIDPAARQRVLDELINLELLAEAAGENGYALGEAALQERIDDLAGQMGGQPALAEWLAANSFSEADFRLQLGRAARAAWMQAKFLEESPTSAEQIHALQLLFRTAEEANQAYASLQAGEDFQSLARQTDPLTGGEMGWLARGQLFFPELEAAAFQLQAGQYSPVIQTTSGYHILYVLERQADRPLDTQARLAAAETALQTWLETRRQESLIEILVP